MLTQRLSFSPGSRLQAVEEGTDYDEPESRGAKFASGFARFTAKAWRASANASASIREKATNMRMPKGTLAIAEISCTLC